MLYGIPTVWLRIFVVTWRRLCRCVAPVHTSPHTRPLPSTGVSFGLLAGSRARINFDSVPFDRIVIYRNAPPSKKCIRQHFLFVLCSFVFDSKVFAREWVRALWQWFSRVWNDSHNLTGCRANSLICKRYRDTDTTPQYLCVFDIFACAFLASFSASNANHKRNRNHPPLTPCQLRSFNISTWSTEAANAILRSANTLRQHSLAV